MPPIEIGPHGPVGGAKPVRPVNAADQRAKSGPVANDTARSHAAPQSAVVRSSASLDPGAPPIDAERVATIRKAVERGTYPVIPMRVADAMIAAGFLLRSDKA